MASGPTTDPAPETLIRSEPERARRTLSDGVLLFRWVAFTWMTALAFARGSPFQRPFLAWTGLVAAGLWTVWLTASRGREPSWTLLIDLALSAGLVVMSGYVVPRGSVTGLFYATAYPLSTALAWGAAWGLAGAAEATLVLGTSLVLSRPVNGISLAHLDRGQLLGLVNGMVNYLLAGSVAGVVSRHLDRSTAQLRSAIDEAIAAGRRAARLAERDSIGRAIHDSVLQALALLHKRGRELGTRSSVGGSEVLELAEMAGQQEAELRSLILREPTEAPAGSASLRQTLEALAEKVTGLRVTVSAVGPLWLPARPVDELAAAVRQALDNVVEHAGASRAAVFADLEDGWVTVSVRDDGAGFDYDEERLREGAKAGMLKSMKGRVEELGGRMRVLTAPGAGTEVEFRVPVMAGVERR